LELLQRFDDDLVEAKMSRRALLLYNPKAGRATLGEKGLEMIIERLQELQIEAQVQYSSNGQKRSLNLAGKDLLIVCGGDGTIHDTLPDAVEANVPVAIVPVGTANVLARELSIPRDPLAALQILKTGRTRKLHLGKAGDRYFHLMAGVGLDGYLLRQVGPSLKRFLGVGAFWLTGFLRFWSYSFPTFRVKIGEELHTATFAVISNSRLYGGHLRVTPQADVFDDTLDVCLFSARSHFRYVKYLWGSLRGKHLDYPDVIYRKARVLEVVGESRITVQLDGELAGTLPRHFEMAKETLEVFVPGSET
jgi:YegS/Rv2252/BmrU family lipid kinase